MTARVSVLVPSYNYGSQLRRCIDSVLAQRYPHFELVISDDASSDDSDAIVRSYADRRIVYERQPHNLGMVPNWRRCVELASGEYLLLLGADDYLKPNMLARCAEVLDRDPDIAFCHTAAEFFDEHGKIVSTTGAFRRSYVAAGTQLVEGYLKGRRVVNSASVFRRSCFEAVGGWSDAYKNCMDLDLWYRMLLRFKVGYVGEILVGFRSHPVSHRWTMMQAEEDLRFLRSMFARLPPELAHLRTLQPQLEHAQATRSVCAVLGLPPSPERDQVLARLQRETGITDVTTPLMTTTARQKLKTLALVWLARLPAPMRYRIGDRYAA